MELTETEKTLRKFVLGLVGEEHKVECEEIIMKIISNLRIETKLHEGRIDKTSELLDA